VCAALNRRNHDGEGSFLDVSMLETAMTAMGWVVSDYLIGGRPPGRAGNENVTSAPSGTFRTADGQLNIAANTQAQFEAICRVCDRPDLLADARFRGREDRKQHRDELRAELEQTLLARPAAHWEAAFATAGIPAGRVLTVTEALEQEQVRQRDIRHVIGVPGIPPDRSVEILGSGIHVNERSLAPRSSPPTLGQHTSDVLEELGYTVAEIADLRCTGAI
jgi:crotonobetainyl-CoA:carnitine CoA-transferase CaiB-like acyl-CoA transferase